MFGMFISIRKMLLEMNLQIILYYVFSSLNSFALSMIGDLMWPFGSANIEFVWEIHLNRLFFFAWHLHRNANFKQRNTQLINGRKLHDFQNIPKNSRFRVSLRKQMFISVFVHGQWILKTTNKNAVSKGKINQNFSMYKKIRIGRKKLL